MLTLIFAVYALSLLVALLVVGSLSDYVGRRPVIFAAPMLGIAAGALGTSVLVMFAPLPLLMAFIVLLIAFVLQALYL